MFGPFRLPEKINEQNNINLIKDVKKKKILEWTCTWTKSGSDPNKNDGDTSTDGSLNNVTNFRFRKILGEPGNATADQSNKDQASGSNKIWTPKCSRYKEVS